MTKPITPDEVSDNIPDEVIAIFNELIKENWYRGAATILQNTVLNSITLRLNITREEAFAKGYLDVEEVYRKAGWDVTYDKPAYNESYEPFFVFKKQ